MKKNPKKHESMWEKIVRERKEERPKYRGGQYKDGPLDLSYHFRQLSIKEGRS